MSNNGAFFAGVAELGEVNEALAKLATRHGSAFYESAAAMIDAAREDDLVQRRLEWLEAGDEAQRLRAAKNRPTKPLASRIAKTADRARQPRPEPLISGLIDSGSFTVLFGPGGSGKSFVALDLACCVSLGLPWQGRDTRQGPVLYVVAEGGSGTTLRAQAWSVAHHGVSDSVDWVDGAVDLFGGAEIDELVALIEQHGYVLVIFDTYNRCTPGLDENSAESTGVAIAALARLQSAGAAVLVVHHTPKDGGQPRGSAALYWASDHGLEVRKSGASVTVINDRQKDRATGGRIPLTLVAEPLSESAYLVEGVDGRQADEPINPQAVLPIGDELTGHTGPGASVLPRVAQYLAQNARPTGTGRSRAEAARALTMPPEGNGLRQAWDVLWKVGALTPATGSRTPTGRCWWIEPGDGRTAELARRALGNRT